MMKATPPSPLVVAEPELLFEFLVVALDPPAQLGGVHQGTAAAVCGQRGQKVFRWLGFIDGPVDQAPFLRTGCGAFIIAMPGADTAKRAVSLVLVPSRQVTRRQASLGRSSASCLAEIG